MAVLSPRPDASAPTTDRGQALPRATRDPTLDLLRGLAIALLVVNHLPLESPLETATSAVLSAAEMLVCVSGVVAGMVFGRRWLTLGGRCTTLMLLRRARKLYVAAVAVVSVFGLMTLVPWLATDGFAESRAVDHYAYDGTARLLQAILTLEAGPWHFNILGFFVVVIALTPALLWALARGWWPLVALASLAIYVAGRTWEPVVLPSQSEQPFPLLIWQVLYVGGLLVGWHREHIAAAVARRDRLWFALIALLAIGAVAARLAVDERHFDKDLLDPERVFVMVAIVTAMYLVLQRYQQAAELLASSLRPLGANSFYVYIMQVFVCLAVASVPALAGSGLGPAGNTLVQIGCLIALWVMVRRRVLFQVVPR